MKRDPETFELDFDCPSCPTNYGVFTVRVSAEEQRRLSPTYAPFRCPRGHKQNWTSYRGFLGVDDAGHTIDRRHPLWFEDFDPLTSEYLGRNSGIEL